MGTQKRIKILSEAEIAERYALPRFNDEERQHYFALSPQESLLLGRLGALRSRITFILQLGYFKANQQFYQFDTDSVHEDVMFIRKLYFPDAELEDLDVSKVTLLKQRGLILELTNYRLCNRAERESLTLRAHYIVKVSSKPIYVLRELLTYLSERRVVAPGYTTLQDTVGEALSFEQQRLIEFLTSHLSDAETEWLDNLLDNSEGLHEITQIKRLPKGLTLGDIRIEVERKETLEKLHGVVLRLLPQLRISNESVNYYASLVGYYTAYKLKRLNRFTAYLYLLCFVHYRYGKLHDNLVQSLLHHVKRFNDHARDEAKERVYKHRLESNRNLPKAAEVLGLFTATDIPDDTPFGDVKARAFKVLSPQKLTLVATHISTRSGFDETELVWQHIDERADTFKRFLRPITAAMSFSAMSTHHPTLQMLEPIRLALRKKRALGTYNSATFPTMHLGKKEQAYLYDSDTTTLLTDRYEFLTYRRLRDALESGDIYCPLSIRFRSFEDDLVSRERWRGKDQLLVDIGLPLLSQPIADHIHDLKLRLERRCEEVNQRISTGENTHFQVGQGKQARWSLGYETIRDEINHPFYDRLRQTDISRVLHFAEQHCAYMDSFEHVLGRYAKTKVDQQTLVACLIAWGSNLGLGKMSEISDMGYHALRGTSDNFIRLETLQQANDIVSNAVAALPIFDSFNLAGVIHSSSDGQKFVTQRGTFNARHSPKYFGLGKGVVAYTAVANHIPISARVIGANEHESHYVFDALFNNTTDIQPDLHSTDTHGTNEVNFALLHLFGYRFAPRYKDIYAKVSSSLYGFKQPSQYLGAPLKPIRKLQTDLITSEWDNIQRIMVSLALKTTTQHVIVRKLSAYARRNRTKAALWEYDNIIRSLYLLDYVDSLPLRQNVHTSLNRGENYHQLRRAVSFANFGRLRFRTEMEQNLWSECARLITNCLIFYNACLLSRLLELRETQGDSEGIAALKGISPVAWQHINFAGRYEFGEEGQGIDLDEVIQHLH